MAATAAVVLFLAFFPLPMRVGGTATVAPQRTAQIQAEVPGVVKAVYVREGGAVKQGTVLAELEDWQYRSALAAALAKRDEATAAMNRALASSDASQAGIQRIQADYWNAEVARARDTLEHTKLRSPIDGVVLTPYLENFVGRKMDAGDPFVQVGDTQHASVDVAVDQEDVSLLTAGQSTAVKLESFPTRKFRGQVAVVSPSGGVDGDKRVFFARVDVGNSEGLLRSGMQGRGKVSVGWHSAGFVLLRDIGMRVWAKVWSWFGW
jgi:RND family efflux transporter MFP subunit